MRALLPETMALLQTRMEEIVRHTAAAHLLEPELEIFGGLAATINHAQSVPLAVAAAQKAGCIVRRDMAPSMAAEDFGRFLQEIPGAYAWIGNGTSAPLHNPDYDYNDAILPIAARYLTHTAKAALA
jgi:hippurate hydrolase